MLKEENCNKKVITSTNKSKTTWNIINKITGHKHTETNPQFLKANNKHIKNPEEIAEMFNNYFAFKENEDTKLKPKRNLRNEIKTKCYHKQSEKLHSSSLVFKMISTKEIYSVVNDRGRGTLLYNWKF